MALLVAVGLYGTSAHQSAYGATALSSVQTSDIESNLGRRFVSREPAQAFRSAARPMEGMTIIVDPGHGGREIIRGLNATGATGAATRQAEKHVNLRVSMLLRYYLQEAGATVLMTRVADGFADGMCVGWNGEKERCQRAFLANRNNADMFISVHHNSTDSRKGSTNYSMVLYKSRSVQSLPLAENISSALSVFLGTPNNGAKVGDSFTVLNRLSVPGVIVEASFMSETSEDRRLANLAYNKLEAKAITIGILNYLRFNKGRNVDFAAIFAPVDTQWQKTVAAAEKSVIRRNYEEKKSLWGGSYKYKEYSSSGQVVAEGNYNSPDPITNTVRHATGNDKKPTVTKPKTTTAAKPSTSSTAKTSNTSAAKPSTSTTKPTTAAKPASSSASKPSTASTKSTASTTTPKPSTAKPATPATAKPASTATAKPATAAKPAAASTAKKS